MKTIALTGLMMAEKLDLTVDLARHFVEAGQQVTVINNVHYPALDPARLDGATYIDLTEQIEGDFAGRLEQALNTITGDITLVAVSEMIPPDEVFMALEDVRDLLPEINLRTVALVDDHTRS
jgi:hypothetical protein